MFQSRFLVLAAVAGAAGCAAAALPDKPVLKKSYELPQTDFTPKLKSGLRVLVQEDHSAPVVTVVAAYGVGSTSDPKGVEGLAHFVEHLAFRTKFQDGEPIWEHLKRMGANFNAFTTWDWTVYHSSAHKDSLEQLMQIEAWRLFKMMEGVTPEVFKTEREVVRNERRLGNETVGTRTFDKLAEAMFPPGHSLSRSIIGTHESLLAATLEHAKEFSKKYYRPDNCTIVIAGDVDGKEVQRLIGTWPADVLFGPEGPEGKAVERKKAIAETPLPPVPPPVNRALQREKGPVPQPQLYLAWSAPGAHRRNDALLQFVASRLDLALSLGIEQSEDDDIENIGAGVEGLNDASMIYVVASLKPGADPEKVRARIQDALVHTWTTELGKAQTEATRWFTATGMLLDTANPVGMTVGLAMHFAATGRTSFFKDSLDELAKVQAGEVMDVAHKYLGRDRAVAVYVEPEADGVPKLVGGGGGGSSSAGGKSGGGTPGEQKGHDIGREAVQRVQDLSSQRILQVARSPELARLPRWKMPNGLEVVAARHGSAPVAQIRVGFRGGDAGTNPFGLGSWATTFATSRCRDHGSLMPVGGRMFDVTGLAGSTHFVDVLSGNLANGVAVLSDSVSCLEVNEELFLNFKQRVLDRRSKSYERIARMPDFQAGKRMWAELYPNHPFGISAIDPAPLKGVNYGDAAAFVRTHIRPGNAVAVVVGDIDVDETRTLMEKYMARWGGSGGAVGGVPAAPPAPPARKTFLIDRPQGTQATVRIACRLTDARPELIPIYELAGALANERAWDVREKMGATYGVYAAAQTMPGGAAHMLISGAIENKQVGASIQKLLDILVEVGSERLDEKFFLLKRWDVARQFSQRFADGQSKAFHILEAAEHGWPTDVWDKYPERLAAATRENVRALFSQCVGREIITVSGKASEVRPQLEAAGLKLEAN
jgi:zinc protease